MTKTCTRLDHIHDVTPSAKGCEECLKMGDTWVHLRICKECGHVGCCDSSKNKHATKHFHATSHPVMQSFQPGEDWYWRYVDELRDAQQLNGSTSYREINLAAVSFPAGGRPVTKSACADWNDYFVESP